MKKLLIIFVLFSFVITLGCSQEKSQPAQTQGQQVQKQTAPTQSTGQEFTFRGIKFGIPIDQQFKKCTKDMKEVCYKQNEYHPKIYKINNLPPLEIDTLSTGVTMDKEKVEEVHIEIYNDKLEALVVMLKEKYGSPQSAVTGTTDVFTNNNRWEKCETVTMKWNYQGYSITLEGADSRCSSFGRLSVKSATLVKEEDSKKGKL